MLKEKKKGASRSPSKLSKSRLATNNAINSEKMVRLRNAADPKLERDMHKREEEEIRVWEEEHRTIRAGPETAAFEEEKYHEEDEQVGGKGQSSSKSFSGLGSVLKKASEAAGLCLSELPKQLFEAEDVELGVWSVLVTDSSLKRLARSNIERMKEGVVVGSQLQSSQLQQQAGAVSMMNSLFSGGSSNGGEPVRVPFAGIRALIIPKADKVTDNGLLSLASTCTSLRRLNLEGCVQVSDISIRALAKQNALLEELNLSYCSNINGTGLVTIGECCKRLKVLKLRQCPASEEWLLKRIAIGLPDLRELDLSCSHKVSDETLRTISNRCRKLEKIVLSHCNHVSDVGVLSLSESCSALEYLDLTRTKERHKITDVCLLSLAERCHCLSTLLLSGNEYISDVGISWLTSGCHALQKLTLAKCFKVTDTGLRAIGDGCPELEWLDINGLTSVSDIGLRHLGEGCKKLRHLNCSSVYLLTDGVQRNFGVEGLQSLAANCRALEDLVLTGCFQLASRVFKAFSEGVDPLTELKSLDLGHGLNKLYLQRLPKLTASCLEPLFRGRCGRTLTLLNVSGCERIKDKLLQLIGRYCVQLRILNASKCENISSRGITAMCRGKFGKGLEVLDISFCPEVNDLAMLSLSECEFEPGLNRLNLKGCHRVSETGLAWLAEGVPSLYEINCHGCEGVSVRGLQSICGRWKFVKVRADSEFFGIYPEDKCVDMRFIEDYGAVWKAAVLIQNTYRAKIARREIMIKREIRLKNWTARRLQAYWRGRVARRYAIMKRLQRDREVEAALMIQCAYRTKKARRQAAAEQERAYQEKCVKCAIFIQQKWRQKVARNVLEAAKMAKREYMKKCEAAAIKMQRLWRGVESRRQFNLFKAARLARYAEEEEAATKIQGAGRGYICRQTLKARKQLESLEHEKMVQAAIKVQRIVRGRFARRKLARKKDDVLERERAAIKLQCMWRSKKGSLAVHMMRQARREAALEAAARRVQAAWRAKKGKMCAQLLCAGRQMELEERNKAASKLQGMFRAKRARRLVQIMKSDKNEIIQKQHDLNCWAALMVQKHFRGQVGRKRAAIFREERKKRWKEMFDYEQDRSFYYNQDTGEVRWRKPQDMLDLLPKPKCSNCIDTEGSLAIIECGDCKEYYCEQCFKQVHFGGLRKSHKMRSLYDAYMKRIEYGDGEWPSIWPSEIEQDDKLGWQQIKRAEQAERGEEVTFGIPGLGSTPDEEQEPEDEAKKVKKKEKKKKDVEESEESEESNDEKSEATWRKLYDHEGDCEIYVNMDKKKVVFERPASYESPREEDCWKEYYDETYHCVYYYNSVSRESTYELPEALGGAAKETKVEDVPSPWEKRFDENTGRAFYHNPENGLSVFDRPADYKTPREELDAEEAKMRQPSVWSRYYEEANELGETNEYFYNHQTGQTQYHRPPDFHTPRGDRWIKMWDEEVERECYFNETTGATQFMRPDDFETPRMEGLEEGKNGWCKYPDQESGVMTYYNTITGVTQFVRPSDFLVEAEAEDDGIWERYWDESSGQYYYYHTGTEEMTYDKPDEYVEPEEEEQEAHQDDLDMINNAAVDGSSGQQKKDDTSWMHNEDWSEAGIEAWLTCFKREHPDVVEIKTPNLRPEVQEFVLNACEKLDLDSVTQGFGRMKAIIITQALDDD